MKSLLTAALALSAIAFGTAAANARDHHGHFSFGITIGEPGWGGYPDDYYWDRPVPVVRPVRGCGPDQASAIARDYGFRHRAVYVSHSVLTVTGVRHGRPAEITFARAPGCPVVSY